MSDTENPYPQGAFMHTYLLALDMEKEVKQWCDGRALPYLERDSLYGLMQRIHAVLVLTRQQLECFIDDGK